jgi:hypothetical protein
MSGDRGWRAFVAGGAAALALFALVLAGGGAAWRAWLAAAFLASGVTAGAVVLAAAVRLIPGRWREALTAPLAAEARTLPVGALAMAPVLVAPAGLYAWTGGAGAGFRGAYLTPLGFLARGMLWFAVLALAAWSLRRFRGQAAPVASLLALTPLSLLLTTDWLMSLDPGYASSGYGLYVLAVEVHLALALAVAQVAPIVGLRERDALGGVLFAVLAIWAYLGFMPWFISWSENLPEAVAWFQRRGGAWAVLAWTAIALKAAPGAALIFGHVRRSAPALRIIALGAAAGAVCELAWLVLPAPGPAARLGDLVLYLAAVAALGLFGLGCARQAAVRRAEP